MRAVAYARYSDDSTQDYRSIDAQLRAITEYCQKNSIEIVKVYTDEAKSATTDDRPSFLRMFSEIGHLKIDAVIVHKLDRFSRNRYDSAIYGKKLKDAKIRLVSVLENIDGSPESIIMEAVIQGFSEYYSANLAREVMKGMKEIALKCKHTGGKPLLGYKLDEERRYIIDEYSSQAVKLIFEMYRDGCGYSEIINHLNAKGFRTSIDTPFGKTSLNSILRNEKYTGVYTYGKDIRIEGGMPAIIDQETWKAVREKMKSNIERPGRNKAIRYEYLLTGLIKCGLCGGAMVGNTRKCGKLKRYYSDYECSASRRHKQCPGVRISTEQIERDVLANVKSMFDEPRMNEVIDFIYLVQQTSVNSSITEIAGLMGEQKKIEKKLKIILDTILEGHRNQTLMDEMTALEERKSQISNKILELQIPVDSKKAFTKDEMREYFLYRKGQTEKQLIQTFVQSVVIHPTTFDIHTIVDLLSRGEPLLFKSTISRDSKLKNLLLENKHFASKP